MPRENGTSQYWQQQAEWNMPQVKKCEESADGLTYAALLVTGAGVADMTRYFWVKDHQVAVDCPIVPQDHNESYNLLNHLDVNSLDAARSGSFAQFKEQVLLSPTLDQAAASVRQDHLNYDCYLSHGLWRDFEGGLDSAVILIGLVLSGMAMAAQKTHREQSARVGEMLVKAKKLLKASKDTQKLAA